MARRSFSAWRPRFRYRRRFARVREERSAVELAQVLREAIAELELAAVLVTVH